MLGHTASDTVHQLGLGSGGEDKLIYASETRGAGWILGGVQELGLI